MELAKREAPWFQDAGVKKVIFLTVAFKLTALIVMAMGAFFLPFRFDNYFANFHFPPNQLPDFWTGFKTWDAQHYLYLATFGYTPHLMCDAFYPLFPGLIHLFGFLFLRNYFLTGLLLSNLFTVTAMVFMYRIVREFYDESVAFNACLLLLAFPTGFFLGLIYSDSLFLMLATAFFYFEMKNKKGLYLLCAFFLPLARPIGILVMIPIVFKIFRENRERKLEKISKVILCSLLGLITYFLVMRIFAGGMMAGFEAQNDYRIGKSFYCLFHPIQWFLNNFVHVKLSLNSPGTSLSDRLFFLIYFILLIESWKWLPPHLWVYVLAVGLISGMSGDLTSFMRYMVVIFPIFITMAIRFKSSLRYLAWGSAIVQILFIFLHSINDWVA
jgi:hypothetical protein